MSKPKILFSIPTRHHVEIAIDEMNGMQKIGYTCDQFPYAAQEGVTSKLGRLGVILKNALNLVKKARQFNPDIIYFNSRLEAVAGIRDYITIAVVKTFYHKKVRFIIKSHGSDIDVLTTRSRFVGQVVLPYLRNHVSAWLFLSTEEQRKITELNYFDPERLFTTKNIVRTDQFVSDEQFRAQNNIGIESKILLFVGRIIRQKGVFEVVEAFAKFSVEFDAVLVIVGDGADFQELKEKIAELGIASKVLLTGFIPEKDVIPYYSNADVLVFPTYFPEGFPMALFNSVAAGISVITTPTRAANDYLTEPDNCLWVKAQDSCSVYDALCILYHNEKLNEQMKRNNNQKAKLFSQRKISDDLSIIMNIVYAI